MEKWEQKQEPQTLWPNSVAANFFIFPAEIQFLLTCSWSWHSCTQVFSMLVLNWSWCGWWLCASLSLCGSFTTCFHFLIRVSDIPTCVSVVLIHLARRKLECWTLHTNFLTKLLHTCHAYRHHWFLPFYITFSDLERTSLGVTRSAQSKPVDFIFSYIFQLLKITLDVALKQF